MSKTGQNRVERILGFEFDDLMRACLTDIPVTPDGPDGRAVGGRCPRK